MRWIICFCLFWGVAVCLVWFCLLHIVAALQCAMKQIAVSNGKGKCFQMYVTKTPALAFRIKKTELCSWTVQKLCKWKVLYMLGVKEVGNMSSNDLQVLLLWLLHNFSYLKLLDELHVFLVKSCMCNLLNENNYYCSS